MTQLTEFKKIIITGNLFRVGNSSNPKESNQNINIRWLYNLLSPTLNSVFGCEITPLFWTTNSIFNAGYIYEEQGLKPSIENFSYIYDSKKISPKVYDYITHFFKDSLVIGLELPPFFIKVFDKLKIPYIDFMFHPARFMPDLIMGLRTGSPEIFNTLKQYCINNDFIYSYAGLRKASFHKTKYDYLIPNSALIPGQVYGDTSLITPQGGYYEYSDFSEKIKNVIDTHEHVYIKPHPLNREKKFTSMFSKYNNVSFITDKNFYELISSQEIISVNALTSSTVYEARYFGKNADWFAKYPFDFGNNASEFNKFRYLPVYQDFLKPNFWRDLFNLPIDSNSKEYSIESNVLRSCLHVDWGYEVFK